jgi:hypothetical protein
MEQGPIYIGGLDRCGKTTMRAFLVSHPNIAIPAVGSNMWTYFYGQFGDLGQSDNFERCLQALLHYKHVRFLQPDPDRIRQEFWQGPPTYARLFALFLIHFAEREGKPRWGAQTGLIERYAPRLFAAYPDLKIIHMLRDPRDRYEASLARWPAGKGRAGGAVARWLYSTRLAEKHVRNFPQQYKIVRFEAMVSQPEQTLRDVCAFLGETFQPAMLRMEGALRQRDRLLKGTTLAPGQIPVSPAYIGGFRGKVPQQEIAFMQLHASRKMQAHGYQPDPINFSWQDRLKFTLTTWPNQAVRLGAWLTMETFQQHFPGWVGRKPGERMIIDEPYHPVNQLETL